MPDAQLFEVQRDAFGLLLKLVKDRHAGEQAVATEYPAAVDAAEKEVQKARKTLSTTRRKAEDELAAERAAAEANTARRYADALADLERTGAETKWRLEDQHRDAEDTLKTEYQDKLWTIDSLLEAGEKEAADRKADLDRAVSTAGLHFGEIWERAEQTLAAVNLTREDIDFQAEKLPPVATADYSGKLEKCVEDVDAAAEKLISSKLPRLIGVAGTTWCVFVAGGIGMAVALLARLSLGMTLIVGVSGAIVGGLLLRQLVYALARKQVRDRGAALGVYMAEAERARTLLTSHAAKQYALDVAELKTINASNKRACDDTFRPQIAAVVKQCVTAVATTERQTADKRRSLREEHAAAEAADRTKYDSLSEQLATRFETEATQVEQRYSTKLAAAVEERDRRWRDTSDNWFNGLRQLEESFHTLTEASDASFPDWPAVADGSADLPTSVPGGVRFGEYDVDLFALPDGKPVDTRLLPATPLKAQVPAFLPFPDHAAVLLKAKDAGRAEAVRVLQAMMLRFLTGLPPGKVRFTIFDPVGRGENFASFMHLADSDELLVTSRIWTEPGQIEARLTDLTEHMENVIQKYLRNQYKSIEEYNRAAGEVAEPYRVLVVANFPTHFTPDAAKRLVSVMSSGPACGVCTLVGVDTAAALPRDFRLSDLEQVAFTLNWKDGRFVPKDGTFTPFPLALDAPPPPTEVAKIVRRVGEASKTAGRVEVPFSYIAPPDDQIWKGSTTRGIEVPIGRAGATRRQVFALGQGTAQHALVAGKTGSGKSTLLHALITNLALIYSPDEAELYLIDFKKGVEFKLYAEHQLPHARVVAIESEREFGLSVLQRLDGILRERGEEFRRAGVNDVAGFREARPGVKLPRILLVVDEFQEFFVEDDKLSQEAALLLDRLVRQGRAFGVHVLLGSQTLGGAFSLARSTIDQMAVRIALQCSEADAQLILSKENTAARLLTRPGEAIYNDANGLTEGNDPFQVVWLDEGVRERVVDDLHRRAPAGAYPPPLVFEGSAAGDLTANKRLIRLLEATPEQVVEFGPPTLWLGDPVAIKDPTAAVFRPQSASNLLMVGQSDEAALGVFSAGLVTLAARLRPTGDTRSILLFDGTPDDSDFADHLRGVCRNLGLGSGIVERHHLPAVLGELAAEIDRRNKGESADRSPRFLLVNGLQRFRELRKADDDFSFGRRGEKTVSPGELFTTVLRDGPSVGVHTVVWCDSVTNLNRAFERATLREFAMRALFQMNPNDSSQLIDSPAASRLGRNRALYIEDGSERPEKFRPYGLCELDWVRRVGEQLGLRSANGSVQEDATPVPMPDDAVPERV